MSAEPINKNFYLIVVASVLVSVFLTYAALHSLERTETVVEITDPEEEELITVELSGAVKNPGVYHLPRDARLADLVQQGGGLSQDASLEWLAKNLNLAQKLEDESKYYVPFPWDVSESQVAGISGEGGLSVSAVSSGQMVSSTTSGTEAPVVLPGGKVNLNTATQEELEELPKIGEVTAKRIIDNRPYKDMQELKDKAKITASVEESIKDLVAF